MSRPSVKITSSLAQFKVCRLFGIFPFRSNGLYSIALMFYSILTLFLFAGSNTWFIQRYGLPKPSRASNQLLAMGIIHTAVFSGIFISHLIQMTVNRNYFEEIISRTIPIDQSRSSTLVFYINCLLYVSISLYYAFDRDLTTDPMFAFSSFWFGAIDFIIHLIIVQYATLMDLIRSEFTTLTLLQNRRILRANTHLNLTSKASRIHRIFQVQILFFATYTTLQSVIIPYTMITVCLLFGFQKFYMVTRTLKLAETAMNMSYCCFICDSVEQTASEFSNTLFEELTKIDSLDLEAKSVLYIKVRPTVQFIICGLFKLEPHLLTSIVSASATYQVLAIQFGMK